MGEPEVGALAINVTIPPALRWVDVRRGDTFELQSLTVRMLADGHLAVKAYGRPTAGGRGAYVSFPVRWTSELEQLVAAAAERASQAWGSHWGLAP